MKIALSFLFLISLSYFFLNTPKINHPESVTSFGYNNQNDLNYGYTYKRLPRFTPYENKFFERANHHSPLYLDIKNGRKLLIFSTHEPKLILWDATKREVFKEIKLAGSQVNSTPIINEKKRQIIVKTKNSDGYKQIITSIDFKGNIKVIKEIDLISAFKAKNKKNIPSKIHCKTALSLLDKGKDNSYVLFACSIKSQVYNLDDEIKLYGTDRGLTGLVVASKLDSDEVLFYRTSIKTESSQSGYDTGIYLSGGSIPIKDGFLYVATGNGPVNESNNHGCSILKLAIDNHKIKLINRFTPSKYTKNECHSLNLDLTSSSPVFISSNKKEHALIVGKSGKLHIFDTETMGEKFNTSTYVSQLPHYSQGATLKIDEENYFVTHWKVFSEDENNRYSTVIESHLPHLVEKGFKKISCLGSILKKEAKSYSLMYSGEFRESYISAPPAVHRELSSSIHPHFLPKSLPFLYPAKDVWPNYVHLLERSLITTKEKYDNNIDLSFYDFGEGSIFLIGETKKLNKEFGSKPLVGISLKSSFADTCQDKRRENIYLMKKDIPLKKAWGYNLYRFNNQTLELVKSTKLNSHFVPNKTSPTVIKYGTKNAFLITGYSNNESTAYLIDPINFKILREFKFKGEGYFSRPLWSPYFLFLPTRKDGLQVLEISY